MSNVFKCWKTLQLRHVDFWLVFFWGTSTAVNKASRSFSMPYFFLILPCAAAMPQRRVVSSCKTSSQCSPSAPTARVATARGRENSGHFCRYPSAWECGNGPIRDKTLLVTWFRVRSAVGSMIVPFPQILFLAPVGWSSTYIGAMSLSSTPKHFG